MVFILDKTGSISLGPLVSFVPALVGVMWFILTMCTYFVSEACRRYCTCSLRDAVLWRYLCHINCLYYWYNELCANTWKILFVSMHCLKLCDRVHLQTCVVHVYPYTIIITIVINHIQRLMCLVSLHEGAGMNCRHAIFNSEIQI